MATCKSSKPQKCTGNKLQWRKILINVEVKLKRKPSANMRRFYIKEIPAFRYLLQHYSQYKKMNKESVVYIYNKILFSC